MNTIFFHNENTQYGYMSNWYACSFTIDNITYNCSEQYMMYQKALLFDDYECANKILNTKDPKKQQTLGRKANGFNPVIWDGMKQIIVYEACLAKFEQNEDIRKQLLDTGDAMLVEASGKDRTWGIGIRITDNKKNDMKLWNGQNLLGFTLMKVREKLNKQ